MEKALIEESARYNLGHLLRQLPIVKVLPFNKKKAAIYQYKTLFKLLTEAKDTVYGREHNFDAILASQDIVASFSKLPIRDYLGMKPYWQRAFEGEKDVAWPEGVSYFALSSGTTDNASKYIPVTQQMLKSIKRAGTRQLMQVARTDFPKDYLTKDYLFVGGSTDLEFNGNNYSGDLSGITTSNLPIWMQRFSKPEPYIKSQKIWADKIDMMVKNAPDWDIAMIAGVPAWIQILFERIIHEYKLNTIHDIWPHLSVYVHGGVSFRPYKKSFDKYLSKPLKYFETYLASEGFVAFQMKENSKGMRLVFKNGVYYEFIPFNSKNFDFNGELLPTAKCIDFSAVQENTDYAIIISTCSGAWRYLIGDTVRFTDINLCEIEITGRTKHFLSLCGEHLSVDNMNEAVSKAADDLGIEINEYTVKGVRAGNGFVHKWYLALDENTVDVTLLKQKLDFYLKASNDDYRVERQHALKDIEINILPKDVFLSWMDSRGKSGAQNKFPRVMNDILYQQWLQFIEQATIEAT